MSSPSKDAFCQTLRQILTTEGREALQNDATAQEHLEGCDECLAFLAAQAELDALLPQLPVEDAPNELVNRVVVRVEQEQLGGKTGRKAEGGALANFRQQFPTFGSWGGALVRHRRRVAVGATLVIAVMVGRSSLQEREYRSMAPEKTEQKAKAAIVGYPGTRQESAAAQDESRDDRSRDSMVYLRRAREAPVEDRAKGEPMDVLIEEPMEGPMEGQVMEVPQITGGVRSEFVGGMRDSKENLAKKDGRLAPAPPGPVQGPVTQGFLAERSRVEGLTFQDADGYWANTYVPGDPAFRLLQSRLEGSSMGLHEDAQQPLQPFDVPTHAALAVYLQADRKNLDGAMRTLLQVGIQATERRSGARPPVNLAMVLDLTALDPGSSATTAAALRALVLALEESRQAGDRFHLVVAGRPGGVLVEPEGFRHGPLLVALQQLFGMGGATTETLDLQAAMVAAVERVAEGDDPNAPLGSNVVLMATPRRLKSFSRLIASLAHQSAVGGVLVSTIGIGDGVDRGELDLIALAGQGNRRLMSDGSQAAGLVERELASASRAVARAVRVRIRLAPGVQLVDVVGSRRLDALQAEEVREAEQGVDLQLARRMSIEADRGDDEEGIQIVIPSFYSGDSHVILLDVVAPGAGAVADVTVRYKDLVYLRNGVARDQLSLTRGQGAVGPLELNVLKNLLAYRLYETLEAAGNEVKRGQVEAARQRLADFAALLHDLRDEIPGLAQDRDLVADQALLERYVSRMAANGAESSIELPSLALPTLADSLRLAARLKILPQPTLADR